MRCIGRRVARRADVADHVALSHRLSFHDPVRIAIEMRVVINHLLGWIGLIDSDAAGGAGEELANRAVHGGDDRRPARREDVDGAMCLVRTAEGFEVFNSLAGARHEVRVFGDEESAYFYLFGVLVADAVRTGMLVPRP